MAVAKDVVQVAVGLAAAGRLGQRRLGPRLAAVMGLQHQRPQSDGDPIALVNSTENSGWSTAVSILCFAQVSPPSLREIASNDAVRAVVIRATGEAFMAGGDLSSFHRDLGQAEQTANRLIRANE